MNKLKFNKDRVPGTLLCPFHASSHPAGARDVLPCFHEVHLKPKTKKYSIENRSEERMDQKDKIQRGKKQLLLVFLFLSPFTLQAFLHPLR